MTLRFMQAMDKALIDNGNGLFQIRTTITTGGSNITARSLHNVSATADFSKKLFLDNNNGTLSLRIK